MYTSASHKKQLQRVADRMISCYAPGLAHSYCSSCSASALLAARWDDQHGEGKRNERCILPHESGIPAAQRPLRTLHRCENLRIKVTRFGPNGPASSLTRYSFTFTQERLVFHVP